MAKDKGRASKRKGPGPLTDPVEPTTYEPDLNDNGAGTDKGSEKEKHLSGFIFMCNQSTKLECYRYRVFGLPAGKKEVVEGIKPGAKLFLFDFESKLLYGIYEATSAGNLNLEPAAFRGRFPAQVKFKIFKECLPLPENSLRHIIKENYISNKFKQELSINQVINLSSSFCPLENVSLPHSTGHQFVHSGRLPPMDVPYFGQMQYNRITPFVQPQHVSNVNPNGYQIASSYVEHVNPASGFQSLTPASSYYVANSQRPSFSENVAHVVHEPSYSSYLALGERAPHDQVTNFERQFYQLASQCEDYVAAYNPSAPALYAPSSVMLQPPQSHAPYYPPPAGSQYQNNVVAYNSNPAPAAAAPLSEYTTAYDATSTTTHPLVGISEASAPSASLYYY